MKLLESGFAPEIFLSTWESARQIVDAQHTLSDDCANDNSSTCTGNCYFTLSCLCLFTLVLHLSLSPTLL